jgi:hypothetical protein
MGSSIEFYKKLGFEVANYYPQDRKVIPSQQAVIFCLYAEDVAAFRDETIAAGIDAGPLEHPFYLPLGEFRVHDPDGYVVMIAQRQ